MLFQNFFVNLPKSATQYGCSIAALALILLAGPVSAQEATSGKKAAPTPAKADKDASAKGEGDAKSSDASDQGGALEALPPNQPVKGLQFPSYDANGKLQMMLMADVATKVDPTHIELQNMKIDATGDDGKSFHVELPFSVFEVPTRVLTGDKGVLIKRDDFELTGDAGEFYLKTRFAKVTRNVKMILYSLPANSASPTPSPTSKTDKPAKP
ncbi:hypothetical protein BH09VER1_BH09VER1_54750 [soil metagenome]